jgi:HAD superfamily phosphoserine phosphatase-like hydrolase
MWHYSNFINNLKEHKSKNLGRDFLNQLYYKNFQGVSQKEMIAICKSWHVENNKDPNFFNDNVIKQLHYHQQQKAMTVIVTGSFQEAVVPIALSLGVDVVIANMLEVVKTIFTGNLKGKQIIGQGKAEVIQQLITAFPSFNLKYSYAFADHDSDLTMLNMVGYPVVVGNNPILTYIAKKQKWYIIPTQDEA